MRAILVDVADAPWADGTQPPAPPPVWSDPLADLVTGVDAGSPAPLTVPVKKPKMPDMDEIRRAADALIEEEEHKSDIPQPRPAGGEMTTGTTPGIMPNPRPGWPRPPLVQQLRVRLQTVAGSRPALLTRYRLGTRPSRNAVGVGVAIALLVAAIVLVVLIIYGLADSVNDILR
jgi:hypothetical protein